jgi:hypothetical protein
MSATEICRFTVIRPFQKKNAKKTEIITLPQSTLDENRVRKDQITFEPIWEEEIYILLSQIKRFVYAEEIKGPINSMLAREAVVGRKLNPCKPEQT